MLLYGCTTERLTKPREKKLDATSYTEQILEATTHETTAVRQLTFHH